MKFNRLQSYDPCWSKSGHITHEIRLKPQFSQTCCPFLPHILGKYPSLTFYFLEILAYEKRLSSVSLNFLPHSLRDVSATPYAWVTTDLPPIAGFRFCKSWMPRICCSQMSLNLMCFVLEE